MLEQTEKLEPRVSALEEDLSDIEEESEEEEVCYGLCISTLSNSRL